MSIQIAFARMRWLQPALGVALILHALAHASAVVDTASRIGALHGPDSALRAEASLWRASLLSALTLASLLAAGFGALHVKAFERHWRLLAMSGLVSSLVFLFLFEPNGMIAGATLSCALIFLVHEVVQPKPLERISLTPFRRIVRYAWVLALSGMAVSLAARPVYLRWGTTPREAYFDLPGDQSTPGKGFQILHAINIEATPEQVWPWLAQIGHDRGGFYSYSWLENLFGLHVVNADRVVPEWQTRALGEVVPATPPKWLGLVEKPLGWRVTQFEPGHVLFLENWGAFALVRTGPASTRLYIRTQGDARTPASLWWSPVELLVFEPAHFIMQRRMLIGIRARAEQLARQQRNALTFAR
jgi:hypothetical protein